MNTDILSIDPITVEEMPEEPATPLINETVITLFEIPLHLKPRFVIVDLWKIRSTKRHLTFYT